MAVVARHAAWMGRHQPWAPSDKRELLSLGMVASDDYDRILGPSPILDPNVVLKSEVRKQTSIFTFDWEIDFEHYVWGGTWDHQEIPFERHRRLTPSRKFTIFTDVDVNWSRFGSLAGLANSALASAAEQARENYQSANRRDGEADRVLSSSCRSGNPSQGIRTCVGSGSNSPSRTRRGCRSQRARRDAEAASIR